MKNKRTMVFIATITGLMISGLIVVDLMLPKNKVLSKTSLKPSSHGTPAISKSVPSSHNAVLRDAETEHLKTKLNQVISKLDQILLELEKSKTSTSSTGSNVSKQEISSVKTPSSPGNYYLGSSSSPYKYSRRPNGLSGVSKVFPAEQSYSMPSWPTSSLNTDPFKLLNELTALNSSLANDTTLQDTQNFPRFRFNPSPVPVQSLSPVGPFGYSQSSLARNSTGTSSKIGGAGKPRDSANMIEFANSFGLGTDSKPSKTLATGDSSKKDSVLKDFSFNSLGNMNAAGSLSEKVSSSTGPFYKKLESPSDLSTKTREFMTRSPSTKESGLGVSKQATKQQPAKSSEFILQDNNRLVASTGAEGEDGAVKIDINTKVTFEPSASTSKRAVADLSKELNSQNVTLDDIIETNLPGVNKTEIKEIVIQPESADKIQLGHKSEAQKVVLLPTKTETSLSVKAGKEDETLAEISIKDDSASQKNVPSNLTSVSQPMTSSVLDKKGEAADVIQKKATFPLDSSINSEMPISQDISDIIDKLPKADLGIQKNSNLGQDAKEEPSALTSDKMQALKNSEATDIINAELQSMLERGEKESADKYVLGAKSSLRSKLSHRKHHALKG